KDGCSNTSPVQLCGVNMYCYHVLKTNYALKFPLGLSTYSTIKITRIITSMPTNIHQP
ncbi:hypothetical protein ACJX0J_027548, partial [Zea mays]